MKMMTLKISKDPFFYIDRFLVYIFFVFTIILFLFNYNSQFFIMRFVFLIIAALRGYCISAKQKNKLPFKIAIIILVSWLFCFLFQDSLNYSISNLMYTLCYIGFAVLLIEGKFGTLGSSLLLGICVITILGRYMQGINPSSILTANSRNYISILLLLPLLLFYINEYKEKKKIHLLPAVLYLIICIIGNGRGGIICAVFLMCALCMFKAQDIRNKWAKKLLFFLSGLIIVFTLILLFDSNLSTIIFKRFYDKGYTDPTRTLYWCEFFKKNIDSLTGILFGSDVSLLRLDRNLHNSFLQAYASFGLLGFTLIIVLCVRSIICGLKEKEYLWVIFAMTFYIRSFTDRMFFQGYCEVWLFYFIMYWFFKLNKKDKRLEKE